MCVADTAMCCLKPRCFSSWTQTKFYFPASLVVECSHVTQFLVNGSRAETMNTISRLHSKDLFLHQLEAKDTKTLEGRLSTSAPGQG